ncbi:MAG: ABC transporter permease [Flavobacteriales bacterium]|nr:ABC transporter permease [Flavobacteriales bacterium]
MASNPSSYNWKEIISSQSGAWKPNFAEIWRYRDLMMLLVHRDFVTFYKQTVLGPIWFVLQPILSTALYMFIFGRVAHLSTDGIPQILFYLSGITAWNYFAECVTKTSNAFTVNAGIFGKVYFPRLIVPLSTIISNLLKLGIQMLLFVSVLIYFLAHDRVSMSISSLGLILPFILMMALLGLGVGLIISSLTTRYRDLQFLVQFGIQLMMFATPVVYPLSMIPVEQRWLLQINPMTTVIEGFRYVFFGRATLDMYAVCYSIGVTILLVFAGLVIFHRVERSFIDTV